MKLKKKEMQAKLAELLTKYNFRLDTDYNVWEYGEPWFTQYVVINVERGKYRLECKVNGCMAVNTIDQLEALFSQLYCW